MKSLAVYNLLLTICICIGLVNCHPVEEPKSSIKVPQQNKQKAVEKCSGDEFSTYFVHYGYTREDPNREIDLLNCSTRNQCSEMKDLQCPNWLLAHVKLEYDEFIHEMKDLDAEIQAVYYTEMFTIQNGTHTFQKERLLYVPTVENATSLTDLSSPYETFKLDFRTYDSPLFSKESRAFRVNFESPLNASFKKISLECHPSLNCSDEEILALQKLGVEAAKNSSDWAKVVIGTTGLKGTFDLGIGADYATFEFSHEGKLQGDWSQDKMKMNIKEVDKQWVKTCKCALKNKSTKKCFDEAGTRDDLRAVLDISTCPKTWSVKA